MRFAPLAAVLLAAATSTFAAGTPVPKDKALAQAVAGSHRSPQFVARDKSRNPQAELEFFGIKPNMTVVEIWPAGGYWTEILGPYLKARGTYYTAISPSATSERTAKAADAWKKKMADGKDVYGDVKVTEFGKGAYDIAPPGSVDMVLTFRNVHNWMPAGFAEEAFPAFFKALKPGGILGVEDHRASTDKPQDPKSENGYVREDYVIALAEKAGFKFVGKSEINANPKDTRDWPKGVWTLPPTLALGEQDKDKYVAIGEADNFVLKFQKPKK